LKTTHWFHLTCSSKQKLVPQTEEDIAAIEWVKFNNIAQQMNNTYPSIKDILAVFLNTIKPTSKAGV
jgi:hypothetical protein